MWRQNPFSNNPDSDQSISDEEEFDRDCSQNCMSLAAPAENKEGLQVPSQLEILRGSCELNRGRTTSTLSYKKKRGFSLEDEGEMPVIDNGGDFIRSPGKGFACNSDEEMISDDEENNALSNFPISSGAKRFQKVDLHIFGSEKQDEGYTWSTVAKEAEALVRLNENASCSSSHDAYSKANVLCKGAKGKARPKFSFRFQSPKEEPSWPLIPGDENDMSSKVHQVPEGLESVERRPMEQSMAELLGDFQVEKKKQSEIHAVLAEVALVHGYTEHSMAELLDGLQEKNGLPRGNSKMYSRTKERRLPHAVKRSISPLRDRNMDNEDLPDPVDSGPSSDDEANLQNLKLTIVENRRKTMADRFHEALDATSVNDEGALFAMPKQMGIGLFGKLQRVMQSEKERDMNFLKKLQTGASSNSKSLAMTFFLGFFFKV